MSDTTATVDKSVRQPILWTVSGGLIDKTATKATAVVLGGMVLELSAPEPTITFVDEFESLDASIAVPTLDAYSYETHADVSSTVSIPEGDINSLFTIGSLYSGVDVPIPEVLIESHYTFGDARVNVETPKTRGYAYGTSAVVDFEIITPESTIVSRYTIGGLSDGNVSSPDVEAESIRTSGELFITVKSPGKSIDTFSTVDSISIESVIAKISISGSDGTKGVLDGILSAPTIYASLNNNTSWPLISGVAPLPEFYITEDY